jgi:NTP pyrophosphatase (non-canonical NTP hydrolase)
MNFAELRQRQIQFEDNLEGTDGKLADLNTPEYILQRGIIGEANEALDALSHGVNSDEFRDEITDIIVFIASLLNHIGMSQEELEQRTERIVVKNFVKYRPLEFVGVTLQEGVQKCRDNFVKY